MRKSGLLFASAAVIEAAEVKLAGQAKEKPVDTRFSGGLHNLAISPGL
ncbi:MAG: hypothetical protein ACR2NP_22610 [Pirellulaceae bacterium]